MDDVDERRTIDGPFIDGKVYVLDRKCDTCIFRPGNLMHLKEGAVEAIVTEAIEENTVINCHDTITEGPRSVCRGYYDVHRQEVPVMRLAAAFNVFHFVPPPKED